MCNVLILGSRHYSGMFYQAPRDNNFLVNLYCISYLAE